MVVLLNSVNLLEVKKMSKTDELSNEDFLKTLTEEELELAVGEAARREHEALKGEPWGACACGKRYTMYDKIGGIKFCSNCGSELTG